MLRAALILAMNIYDDIGSTTLAPNSVMFMVAQVLEHVLVNCTL